MRAVLFLLMGLAVWNVAVVGPTDANAAQTAKDFCIVAPKNASQQEALAAREIRRYLYLRTGQLLSIYEGASAAPKMADAIMVGQKDRPFIKAAARTARLDEAVASLAAQQYLLKTIDLAAHKTVLVCGGDDLGTLYAAYRLAEHLGVRFYLHGDVVPDTRMELQLPILDERSAPLFELRGIQPFHDFPEGPDWWNQDDYLAILSQLPKLRMNFFGLHTYPEGAPNAEPTVWIGLAGDADENGQVKHAYPASYQNTLRGNWGYATKKTSDYTFGGRELFEHDAYGADTMIGLCPEPQTPDGSQQVFHRAGAVLNEVFHHAHELGIKTCVGTETPLTVPKRVQERLTALGKDPGDSTVIQELYEGIFSRIAKTHPLDYYWFWTPEGWTWEGTSEAQVKATLTDLRAAIAASKKVATPFQLATCGWVLGPAKDRALFDHFLPKDMPVSCINREVGKAPVDAAFARVSGRGKWAIPWMEDDPALTQPQLWVGRMRRDAADALQYGCNGLMGIHWRTRVLAPNVSALAHAAWDQSGWNKGIAKPTDLSTVVGPIGGQTAGFLDHAIEGTTDDPLYQTVRYNMSGYRFKVPNGKYAVTLRFCEPHYTSAGKRIFSVEIQGKRVTGSLDIFAKVGQNKAYDVTVNDVAVTDGRLNIDFVPNIEYPSIAAIDIQGEGFSQKVNCGGPAYQDYIADWPASPPQDRYLPCDDFYQDWASHEFGPEAGLPIAAIFQKIDGRLPRPADWVNGPGGIKPDPRPWSQVSAEYAFVDELAALRSQVKGPGNLERFDYWLHTFLYLRGMAQVNCAWAEYNKAMDQVKAEKNLTAQRQAAKELALPLRKRLVELVGELYGHLLATVSNHGEMGTIANWEQHLYPTLLDKPGDELAQILGEPLPPDAMPRSDYRGPMRIIVPTLRSSYRVGEKLRVKVIILSEKPPKEAGLYWREMGKGEFSKLPLKYIERGVYSVTFPKKSARPTDLEYYVRVQETLGKDVYFPVTAPQINQTVALMPGS